ncbi:MAG: GGDEF domain-containing protein [bacterium]
MTVASPRRLSAMPERDLKVLEWRVLVLQSSIACFFVVGTLFGWFGTDSDTSKLGAMWIGLYHVIHAVYVLHWRVRGRNVKAVEFVTPLFDISCITTAWVVIGQAQSPFWAVYLYALVGYGRRYVGRRYFALAGFILVNMVLGRILIANGELGSVVFDANLLTMVVLGAAMASLSQAIGSAWRNAERRARTLAETDALTGISNRRVFLDQLDEYAADAGAGFALLMLDLDDFKRLNDEFGHLHGDEVLARVAQVLNANLREGDKVARYGGEEFVVFMPDTSLREAVEVAERLRLRVFEGTPTSVSVGCAVRALGDPAGAVLRRADDLLLTAKRNGKNAVRATPLLRSA